MVYLHKTLLLPLDDLLAVTREFQLRCSASPTPAVSRSGLDRCLRRHGVGCRRDLLPPAEKTPSKTFKAYAPGFVHVDVTRRATKLKYLPQMQDETSRRYLFVAIDCATRWVFIAIKPNKTAASAQAFIQALNKGNRSRPYRVPGRSAPRPRRVLKIFRYPTATAQRGAWTRIQV